MLFSVIPQNMLSKKDLAAQVNFFFFFFKSFLNSTA